MNAEDIWDSLLEALRNKASASAWSSGLDRLRLVDYANNTLTIAAPNQILLMRVQQKYLPLIQEELGNITGATSSVALVVEANVVHAAPVVEPAPLAPPTPVEVIQPGADRPMRLNKNMTF